MQMDRLSTRARQLTRDLGDRDRLVPKNGKIKPVYAIDGQALREYRPEGTTCCSIMCCCGAFRVPGLPHGSVPLEDTDKPSILSEWHGVWFPKIVKLDTMKNPHPAFGTYEQVEFDAENMILTGGVHNFHRNRQTVTVPNERMTRSAWPAYTKNLAPVCGYRAPDGTVFFDNAGVKSVTLEPESGQMTFKEAQIECSCCLCWHKNGGAETLLQRSWKRDGQDAPVQPVVAAAACAEGAEVLGPVVVAEAMEMPTGNEASERLRQLKALMNDGVISLSDFEEKKRELLRQM